MMTQHASLHVNTPGCDKKFKSKRYLTNHLESHKTVQCEHCGKDYKGDLSLRAHVLYKHSMERNFPMRSLWL